ncbi:SMP-30/gluconolactonase/LRE family protein, partial [Muricoccus pecuniae]|uniref:SMP-30/gluconolactonase/LRE family protein n=1 Tax=Muricoccus pecuniae TaxID=693023 RepID=UPI0016217165
VTRANQIWRLPLHADGSVTKASIFCHLHGGPSGPDGMALDAEGCLLVCHSGFGTVWRLSPRAEPLARIASCGGWSTTNLAFRPGTAELFITDSETGSILHANLPAPGLGLHSHA